MKLIRAALGSFYANIFSNKCHSLYSIRKFSISNNPGSAIEYDNNKSSESADDFEQRIFGGFSGNNQDTESFYQKLDKLKKAHGRPGFNSNLNEKSGGGSDFPFMDGLDESFSTLSDGMDGKLKKATAYFDFDVEEINQETYAFRPDRTFRLGDTYEPKDLDLNKPSVSMPFRQNEFQVTTEEVLKKADFRNVRFLANFLTESGIIIKRSQTRISAKAQRKVAREIKTARAFGLMPFTTMGQYPFRYGKSREDRDSDDDYERYTAQDRYMEPGPESVLPLEQEPVLG